MDILVTVHARTQEDEMDKWLNYANTALVSVEPDGRAS